MLDSGDKVQAFDPANASLNDENAVVISVDQVTPYLDAALKALGLHIEARTSFITYVYSVSCIHCLNISKITRYWLPFLLEHKYIAFRFLPQASYEQAAPLEVSPIPDIVTRIFMIFKGVEESELEVWPAARKRVNVDVSAWIDIVGVDVRRTVDKGLFRVIEWGGMEVACSGAQLEL